MDDDVVMHGKTNLTYTYCEVAIVYTMLTLQRNYVNAWMHII